MQRRNQNSLKDNFLERNFFWALASGEVTMFMVLFKVKKLKEIPKLIII
jgi:hypothetical protein